MLFEESDVFPLWIPSSPSCAAHEGVGTGGLVPRRPGPADAESDSRRKGMNSGSMRGSGESLAVNIEYCVSSRLARGRLVE